MLLFGILAVILSITGLIQKIIDISVVLTLPSKILSLVVGLINGAVIVFIMLFVMLNINPARKYVYKSYIAKTIMERTIVLSSSTSNSYLAYEEINYFCDFIIHSKVINISNLYCNGLQCSTKSM